MNKQQQQKRFLQINHAISGFHGQELKNSALHIYEIRKDILRRLQRKKKLAAVINDQLYSYLQKFPEEKMGLHQESFKKKKAKLLEADQKITYSTPTIHSQIQTTFSKNPKQELRKLSFIFSHPLVELNSQEME